MSTDKGRLKDKMDKLLQQINVPLNPKCIVCGAPTSEMHHYIEKKKSLFLRWDKRNIVPLCRNCHCRHHFSGDPRIVQQILRVKGNKWADELEQDRRVIFRDSMGNLQTIYERLKDEYNSIKCVLE